MRIDIVASSVITENKKILLVIDAENQYKIPGGRKEDNETFEETVKREAKEEISSDVKVYDLINVFSVIYQGVKYAIFNYRAKLLSDPKPANEVKSLGWHSYEECKKLNLSPNAKHIVEFLHKKGEF